MLTGSVTDFELPSPLKCQGTSAIVAYISPFTRYICFLRYLLAFTDFSVLFTMKT